MRIRKAIFVLAAFGVFATVAYAAKGYDIEVIFGDLKVEGVQDDGTGKIVCIKSDKNFGTCAAGTVGVNGCPDDCE